MIPRADLSRAGDCTCCGRPVADHFTRRNHKLSCAELAEIADALAAAACCTTHHAASVAIGAAA